MYTAGLPDLSSPTFISKTGLNATTNTPFVVDKNGLLLVRIATVGGAIEQMMIDDLLMMGMINSFTNYVGWSVGSIPLRKGTHYMRCSSDPGRVYDLVFYPYTNTALVDKQCIKY